MPLSTSAILIVGSNLTTNQLSYKIRESRYHFTLPSYTTCYLLFFAFFDFLGVTFCTRDELDNHSCRMISWAYLGSLRDLASSLIARFHRSPTGIEIIFAKQWGVSRLSHTPH